MAFVTARSMILLQRDEIRDLLDWQTLIEALRHGHRRDVDLVERVLLSETPARPNGQNHLLMWPAWRFRDYCGAKLVTVFPANTKSDARSTNSTVYVLFDGRDGRPLAVIEGSEFTLRKTAADSALGVDYLAREDAWSLLMIGAGAQAHAQICSICAMRPSIRRVMIWNRTSAKARSLAERLVREGVVAQAVLELAPAVREAAIVSMATAACEPLLEGAWLSPGTHVDLVGSFTPLMRECDDETVRRASLFVDSRRFTVTLTGDLAIPIAARVISQTDIQADLFDLVRGRHGGRRAADEITLFKNGGGGHLDLMTAIAAYERATGGRPDT
jgi:ornithine cyclodeaminase/alanine dehydrogenase-like protein (mu-crystallin family)